MTYSIEDERDSLWSEVEEVTGVKFISRKRPPEKLSNYSDEAKEAIGKLENVYQRIHNRDDVGKLSRMMKELNRDGELSPEMRHWWLMRY